MQEVKRALRKELMLRRSQMLPESKRLADERIFLKLKPLIDNSDSVLTYVSTDIEVDTRRVIEYCFEKNVPVAVPVSGDTELQFHRIYGFSDLASGRFGIMEPINREACFTSGENTLCIVPALCADGEGLRLGYGRGYYDRFLRSFNGKSVIICYASFRMQVPSEPHDERADMTIFD
ncbi:MAG: 5-formyltetrahydrofolate cyclo-ligase [Oscillospiraceae bacterium]